VDVRRLADREIGVAALAPREPGRDALHLIGCASPLAIATARRCCRESREETPRTSETLAGGRDRGTSETSRALMKPGLCAGAPKVSLFTFRRARRLRAVLKTPVGSDAPVGRRLGHAGERGLCPGCSNPLSSVPRAAGPYFPLAAHSRCVAGLKKR
jgi:hypothetical protein